MEPVFRLLNHDSIGGVNEGGSGGRVGESEGSAVDLLAGAALSLVLAFVPTCVALCWSSRCCGHFRSQEERLHAQQEALFANPARRREFVEKNLLRKNFVPQSSTHDEDVEQGRSEADEEDEDIDENMCAICLAKYQADDELAYSSNLCQHQFHKTCIEEWLYQHPECPICRKIFLQEDVIARNDDARGDGGEDTSMSVESATEDHETPFPVLLSAPSNAFP